MTIAEIRLRRRWIWLALPDDAEQCVRLAQLLHRTEHRQAQELVYLLDCLRRLASEVGGHIDNADFAGQPEQLAARIAGLLNA